MRNSLSKILFSLKTKILSPKLASLYKKTADSLQVENIANLNLKKRQVLFQHAITHSNFYRKKYEHLEVFNAGNMFT